MQTLYYINYLDRMERMFQTVNSITDPRLFQFELFCKYILNRQIACL